MKDLVVNLSLRAEGEAISSLIVIARVRLWRKGCFVARGNLAFCCHSSPVKARDTCPPRCVAGIPAGIYHKNSRQGIL